MGLRTTLRRWVLLLGAFWLVFHATPVWAAPHTFDGTCQIAGVVGWTSYQASAYTFTGSGTCSGSFDGDVVQDASIKVRTEGEVMAFYLPVLGSGLGTIEFTDQKLTFPIAVQQTGPLLRVFVACHGCSGGAIGALENATETQPEPEARGPRLAIRIVTETIQTFTR